MKQKQQSLGRLAVVTPVFPPYRGGIGQVAYENARMAAENGFDVTIFTPWYKKKERSERTYRVCDRILVQCLLPFFEYGNAALLPQLLFRLRSFDSIHLHYPFIGGAFFVLCAKIFFRKKLLVTYHMDLVGGCGAIGLFFKWSTACMLPCMMRVADRVLVTSYAYAHAGSLRSLAMRWKEKIAELPNSVDTDAFFPDAKNQRLCERYGIRSNEQVILFVGTLDHAHYFKGLDILFDAFIRVRLTRQTTRLLVVGDGDVRPAYEQLAFDKGCGRGVIFAGRVPQKELSDHYNLCDAFVLPSIQMSEAFGVVLIEAMACGKPVITSDLAGPASIIREGRNGFVVPRKDSIALAQKILEILSDPLRARVMGGYSRKIVEQHYAARIIADRLHRFLVAL